MTSPDPENVLSAALRAQAGGSPNMTPPFPEPAPAPAQKPLPWVGVLVFALVLGLATGAVAAVVTVAHSPF